MITLHSELPWAASESFVRVREANGETIALVYGDDPTCAIDDRLIANTEFIVRACNAHDDLLKSLASVLPILDAVRYTVGLSKTQLERIESARAALAKAGAA